MMHIERVEIKGFKTLRKLGLILSPTLNVVVGDNETGKRAAGRQTIVTTHSSFVLNKLDIGSVILLSRERTMTLGDLSRGTRDYFRKLPGYDTLRMILSRKSILVEGPSDELIVQKAYLLHHGRLPLADGVDVIAVGALAFQRFLEVGALLGLEMRVVTDNDGDVDALKTKYSDYLNGKHPNIRVCFDADPDYRTLEPQLVNVNGLDGMNELLDVEFENKKDLLKHMKRNKTDWALKVFNSKKPFKIPDYIERAIQQ